MEDMDDVRKGFGTVADFSNWEGIKASGGFKSMKVLSREKVIEETDINEKEDDKNEEDVQIEIPKSMNEIPMEEVNASKKNFSEIPAVNEAIISPTELKSIAVRLLPSIDKVESNEKYVEYCEKAIDMAFTFLKVWNLKVEIGEANG